MAIIEDGTYCIGNHTAMRSVFVLLKASRSSALQFSFLTRLNSGLWLLQLDNEYKTLQFLASWSCYNFSTLKLVLPLQKSFVPMLHVALFAVLVFLPVNITPWVAVWAYEKLLLVCVPLLSLLEPVIAVLGIMFVSQSLVDEIEERPALVKVERNLIGWN